MRFVRLFVLLIVPTLLVMQDPPAAFAEHGIDSFWARAIIWPCGFVVAAVVWAVASNLPGKIGFGPLSVDLPGAGKPDEASGGDDTLARELLRRLALQLELVEIRVEQLEDGSRGETKTA